jgi:hypothetical protein
LERLCLPSIVYSPEVNGDRVRAIIPIRNLDISAGDTLVESAPCHRRCSSSQQPDHRPPVHHPSLPEGRL